MAHYRCRPRGRSTIIDENLLIEDEPIYGYYKLRSRTVYLPPPKELNFWKKPLDSTFQFIGGPRKGPPPPTAYQIHIARRYYKLECPKVAETALADFNREKNVEYEVVNPSKILKRTFSSKLGLCSHTNFEARPKNDPSAPVELFFAECKRINKFLWVPSRCCSLGIVGKKFDSVKGCHACWGKFCGKIRHPTDAKYLCSPHPPMFENGMSFEQWSRLIR